jgi:hypothetical protein
LLDALNCWPEFQSPERSPEKAGGGGFDSVPGHHIFNNFKTIKKTVSFRFIPKTLVC